MASQKIKIQSQSLLYVAIILGFVVVVNYLFSLKFLRLDLTDTKMYSVSKPTRNMLGKLDDIINIKVYFSKNLPSNLKKTETDVRDILSEYQAYARGHLKVSWEDPAESEETKRKVRALGIPEVQMQSFEKDKAQVVNGFLGIAVLYADKKEVLPLIQEMQNFEYDLTQAIMKVYRSEVPKIGVLKTDTMPYIPPEVRARMQMNMPDGTEEKYKPVFENLKQNYEVETVDISDGQVIKPEIKTLIVPGGESFTERKIFEIDQYFMNGGKLIVLADAVKITFDYGVNGRAAEHKLLNLLEHYGARVERNMVLDASCGQVQIPQRFGMFQMNVAVNYPYFVRLLADGFDKNNPAVAGLGDIIMPWTSSITLLVDKGDTTASAAKTGAAAVPVKAEVLARSSDKSWLAEGYFNLNPQQEWKPDEAAFRQSNLIVHLSGTFNSYFAGKPVPAVKEAVPGDTLSQIQMKPDDANRQVAASNTNGHLVIAGDSDFLTAQNAMPGNVNLLLNLVDWLTLDDNLISVRTRSVVDRTIRKDQLKEGSALPNIIRYTNILTMPLLLIIVGLVIFFRRREAVAAAAVETKTEAVKA